MPQSNHNRNRKNTSSKQNIFDVFSDDYDTNNSQSGIPLIINTDGWLRSTGAEMLSGIAEHWRTVPQHPEQLLEKVRTAETGLGEGVFTTERLGDRHGMQYIAYASLRQSLLKISLAVLQQKGRRMN